MAEDAYEDTHTHTHMKKKEQYVYIYTHTHTRIYVYTERDMQEHEIALVHVTLQECLLQRDSRDTDSCIKSSRKSISITAPTSQDTIAPRPSVQLLKSQRN